MTKPRYKDLTGKKFGKLTVISIAGRNKHQSALWFCSCDCGKEKTLVGSVLSRGDTKSCGCLRKDNASKLSQQKEGFHGLSRDNNGKKERLFQIWTGMKTRCFNKNDKGYRLYGAKGISIVNEWLDYPTFHKWAMDNGYSDELTIEREDVNGDYKPSNCKWIPLSEQANNRTNTVYLTYEGETKSMKEWSVEKGMPYPTLYTRIKIRNWTTERALNEPLLIKKTGGITNDKQ